jgi:hypothetical protein
MGASQLSIYNKALRWLEERKLASLKENREPRRYMDDEWAQNNLFCLSQGNWNFAMREAEFQALTTIQPNFGFAFVFPKPADWNHTYQLADNESYNPLLREWTDQNGYWFADISPIYVKYVSNDPNYGLNLGLWTPAFEEYVAARLAFLCAPRLKQNDKKIDRIDEIYKNAKAHAINTDSKDLPPGQLSYGTWVQSRAPRGSITPIGSPYAGSSS